MLLPSPASDDKLLSSTSGDANMSSGDLYLFRKELRSSSDKPTSSDFENNLMGWAGKVP